MKIDWSEASTKRGLIWVATAIVGAVLIFMNKPIDQLLLLASGVAGGLGMMLKTNVWINRFCAISIC